MGEAAVLNQLIPSVWLTNNSQSEWAKHERFIFAQYQSKKRSQIMASIWTLHRSLLFIFPFLVFLPHQSNVVTDIFPQRPLKPPVEFSYHKATCCQYVWKPSPAGQSSFLNGPDTRPGLGVHSEAGKQQSVVTAWEKPEKMEQLALIPGPIERNHPSNKGSHCRSHVGIGPMWALEDSHFGLSKCKAQQDCGKSFQWSLQALKDFSVLE